MKVLELLQSLRLFCEPLVISEKEQQGLLFSAEVLGVKHDSRLVEKGDAFFLRPGREVDVQRAKALFEMAKQRGASCIFLDSSLAFLADHAIPCFCVFDFPLTLAEASKCVYGDPSLALSLIGVTGTNGKTTITYLTRVFLDYLYGRSVCATVGTLGSQFGNTSRESMHTTPEIDELSRTLKWIKKQGATFASMEVSSIALEMKRCLGLHFDVVAFSNLTQDHLDFHGTMAAYGDSKKRLFTEYGVKNAVINTSDPFGADLAKQFRGPNLVRVSTRPESDADLYPLDVNYNFLQTQLRLHTPRGEMSLHMGLIGEHNVENVLLALGIVHVLGENILSLEHALKTEAGAPGRLERVSEMEDELRVFVDYAHTPDALTRVLMTLKTSLKKTSLESNQKEAQLWCVFGSGGDRDPSKRKAMGEAVANMADRAVLTSDNPRTEDPVRIADEVYQGLKSLEQKKKNAVCIELDRAKAIRLAILQAKKGDVILIAGKGHETYQIVGRTKKHFDDREEAREVLRSRKALQTMS